MDNLESLWANAKVDDASTTAKKHDPVPTGTYNALLEKASLDLTKTPNQVSIWYKLYEGEHAGRFLFANYSLNETGTAILKKELLKLGYDKTPKTLNELGNVLSGLEGKKVEVYAKHRTYPKKDGSVGDAHNVYVNTSYANDNALKNHAPTLDTKDSLPF